MLCKRYIKMEKLPLNLIISRLENDWGMSANKELARRVSENLPDAVDFYISKLGKSIVNYISNTIMHRDIFSDYYIFLSSPYTEDNSPMWKKVVGYKGRNNCTLKTYTSNISCRHFYKIAQKENKEALMHNSLLEYMDYESLLKCDDANPDDSESKIIRIMRNAFALLCQRDQLVLKCLVIDKISSLDAFVILGDYINPRPRGNMSSADVKASLSTKQKQDAVSLLKGRALLKLYELYKQQLKQV